MKVETSIKEAAQLIKEIGEKPTKILEMVKVEMPKVVGECLTQPPLPAQFNPGKFYTILLTP